MKSQTERQKFNSARDTHEQPSNIHTQIKSKRAPDFSSQPAVTTPTVKVWNVIRASINGTDLCAYFDNTLARSEFSTKNACGKRDHHKIQITCCLNGQVTVSIILACFSLFLSAKNKCQENYDIFFMERKKSIPTHKIIRRFIGLTQPLLLLLSNNFINGNKMAIKIIFNFNDIEKVLCK